MEGHNRVVSKTNRGNLPGWGRHCRVKEWRRRFQSTKLTAPGGGLGRPRLYRYQKRGERRGGPGGQWRLVKAPNRGRSTKKGLTHALVSWKNGAKEMEEVAEWSRTKMVDPGTWRTWEKQKRWEGHKNGKGGASSGGPGGSGKSKKGESRQKRGEPNVKWRRAKQMSNGTPPGGRGQGPMW